MNAFKYIKTPLMSVMVNVYFLILAEMTLVKSHGKAEVYVIRRTQAAKWVSCVCPFTSASK